MDRKAILEIVSAIESAQKTYPIKKIKKVPWRSPTRQWDRIIGRVCTGCGKRLGEYEYKNNLAFCYECRRILFPETISSRESFNKKLVR